MQRVARRHNLALPAPREAVRRRQRQRQALQLVAAWTREGRNLLEPGETPQQNLRFLVFLAATSRACTSARACCARPSPSSGNDHRLGANEAPPAIISVFLGDQLTRVLDAIEKGEAAGKRGLETISLGIRKLPEVARDQTDRNRTSPFAFTGNKFEFRAVLLGRVDLACPIAFLNAAVAEALGEFEDGAQGAHGQGREPRRTRCSRWCARRSWRPRPIRFEGNNYAASGWRRPRSAACRTCDARPRRWPSW